MTHPETETSISDRKQYHEIRLVKPRTFDSDNVRTKILSFSVRSIEE